MYITDMDLKGTMQFAHSLLPLVAHILLHATDINECLAFLHGERKQLWSVATAAGEVSSG